MKCLGKILKSNPACVHLKHAVLLVLLEEDQTGTPYCFAYWTISGRLGDKEGRILSEEEFKQFGLKRKLNQLLRDRGGLEEKLEQLP